MTSLRKVLFAVLAVAIFAAVIVFVARESDSYGNLCAQRYQDQTSDWRECVQRVSHGGEP